MLRNLRDQVTPTRRMAAWTLLALLLVGGIVVLERKGAPASLVTLAWTLFWGVAAYLAIRLFAYALLDPLLRSRRTETPGFARDLILVLLWMLAGMEILRQVVQVNVSALLGTGAIAAAVVGLSLQETLGHLFSGISLHLDGGFRVGDWVEVTGNVRGGNQRDTLIGQVVAMTWRSVHLLTENGDTDVIPNRTLAQAVVTNLYAPAGPHRRTGRVLVEPHPRLHHAVDTLTTALAGLPHDRQHPPQVVVQGFDQGGAVLEMRWWAQGFRDGKASQCTAFRLASSVLPREGFALMGPHGPSAAQPSLPPLEPAHLDDLLHSLGLPLAWRKDLQVHARRRHVAPGEGIIREGDLGSSLFCLRSGTLQVVREALRHTPYTGLQWEPIATLEAGAWFGEASLLTGAPRNATVVALTEAELVELPKAAFQRCLQEEPQALEVLADLMARRARERADAEAAPTGPSPREQWLQQIRGWFRLA